MHKISYYEAKEINFSEDERNLLEDRIASLECDYENVSNEAEETYRDLDRAEDAMSELDAEIKDLKKNIKMLESLDWIKIKKERKKEAEYNESVLIKLSNIKDQNDYIKKQMDNVMRDNILLKDQNIDLLNSVKEMKGHSERFQQLDLGIELEYDE
jgi:adenylate cyclase class IV